MDEVTEDDCEMLRQHFMTLDNGNKGYLNEADLASLVPPGDQQQDAVLQLMKHLDADKDGRVSFADFCVGYDARKTDQEAVVGTDEPDSSLQLNEIHVLSEEVFMPDDELTGSPNAAQTQRIVFRHKRFGRRSIPSSTDTTDGTGCPLKLPDEQNTDIQILSPVTMSPPDSRPGSSQEHYPDLASQMESFYQPPVHYDRSRRNSKVLSWINDGKDMLFEDIGAEHGATIPRATSPKYVPPVVEAVEKRNYSLEITKTDVSLMCQHSGGEEETEELMELFDKLDEQKNGRLKLDIFIAGVQSQQCTTNITSTPPPAVGWGPKPVPPLDQSFGTPLPAKSKHPYASVSTPRQTTTPVPPTGAEVLLGNVPLTSFGSEKSKYVTAEELASSWHKMGVDATDEEVDNFIEKLPADQSGYISILDLSASVESALVMDETDHGSKKIALHAIKQEISSLRSQVMHLSMERDKLKADASQALETSRKIIKEEDDIALEMQNMREAEKREIEKKYENKLKDQNRSWSREIERMSEECNQKVVELELTKKRHQDELEAVRSDLQDAKIAKQQFEKEFEKLQSELAEEKKARKALQRDLSCHPESADYEVIESLKERIKELESLSEANSEQIQQLKEENKELQDKNDELQSECGNFKQRCIHEQRKNQRLNARLQAVRRRSRKTSKESTASNDSIQPTVNSGLRFSQPRKSSPDMTKSAYNDQPSPALGKEKEDVQPTVNKELQFSQPWKSSADMAKSANNDQLSPAPSKEKEDVKPAVNSGLWFSQSQKSSTDITKSAYNDQPSSVLSKEKEDVQPTVNSELRIQFSQPWKSSTDMTKSVYYQNDQPSPALSEEEDDFRSESATLLEELTEREEHQAALDRVAELEEKSSDLEEKLFNLESTNAALISANKSLEKDLADSVETEKIASQRLSQDLNKERQHGHTMSMKMDMLSNENSKLAEDLAKLKNKCNELEDIITLLNNKIRVQQAESEEQMDSLTEKHRAEMNKLQETFDQEKEQLNMEIAELKNDLELLQQEIEDKTATLNNAMDVMRAESEEKDVRLSEEKELHESVIEQIQMEHEKTLEMLSADLEDAQRMQLQYLEEAKEKEAIAEQMQADIDKWKSQVAEMEDTHNKQLKLQQKLQKANQESIEQIQGLHNQLSLSQEKTVLMKEKIMQLESDVKSLKQDLEKSKEENKLLIEENCKRQSDIENLTTKQSATVSALTNDQEALRMLADDLNKREREIEALKGENMLIIAERDATGKENAKAVKDLRDQYKGNIDKLKNEIHELKDSNEKQKMAYQAKIEKLKSSIEVLEKCQKENEEKYLQEKERLEEEIRENEEKYLQEKERLEEEISNYVATKVELERELHSMKQEMQEAHAQEVDALQEKNIHLESQLQTTATTYDEHLKSLNTQLINFEERENTFKAQCKEYQEEITQLSRSLDEQHEKEKTLKAQCKEHQENITQLSESLDKLQKDTSTAVEELTGKLEAAKLVNTEEAAQSEEQLCKLQSALDDATSKHSTEKQSLMDQITVLQESVRSNNNKIEQLKKECDESKTNLTLKDEKIEKVMNDMKRIQEEKSQLKDENRQTDQELEEKKVEIVKIQEQLSLQAQKLKEANDHFETERINFDNQIASLKKRLNEQTEDVEKLTLQVQGLKNTHATAVQQIDVKATNLLLEKTQLQEAHDKHQTDLQALQEAHCALQQQLTESQTQEKTILEQFEAQMQSIQEEKAILETNLRETEAQYSEKLAQLEGQMEDVRLENEQLEALSSQMKQQVEENEIIFSKEISEMKEKVERMTIEHQEAISRHAAKNLILQEKVASLQNDIQSSNEMINELKQQVEDSYAAKVASENQFAEEKLKLTQLTHELQSQLDTLNLQLQHSADVHDELDSKHRANEVKINELSSANEDTQLNYNMAIKQLKLVRQCITQFKLKIESQLTETMVQCNQKLVSFKDQLVLSVENISCLQENIKAQLSEHKKESAALEQTILAQKMEYENTHQQNEATISKLREELQHSEERMVAFNNQVKELNELISKIENDFSVKSERLQQECDRYIEKIQQLEAENRNLADQCKQHSTNYDQLMETKDALLNEQEQEFLSQIEALKVKLTTAEEMVSTKQLEIDELQQSLQNISTQAAVMEQKLSSQEQAEDEPDTSEEAIIKVKLANFIQQLKSKLDKLDDQRSSSRMQTNLLEATAEKHETFMETTDSAIEISLQRLDEIQQHYIEEKKLTEEECEQLKNKLDTLSTEYQQIDQQFQKMQQQYVVEIESLRQQFAVKENLCTISSEEKEQLEKECERLKTEIDELKIQLQKSQLHYTVEIDTMQQQFAVKEKLYESKSKETQSAIDNLKQQEEKLCTEIEVLSTKLDTCKAAFAEREKIMDGSICQLEADLQKSEEDRTSQEQSNNDMIQQFKEELVKLQTLLEEEQRTCSTVQLQLDESFTTHAQEKNTLESSIETLNEEVVQLRRTSLSTENAFKQLEVDYKKSKHQYNHLEKKYRTEKDEWTQKFETLQQTNEQLDKQVSSLQVQHETQVQGLKQKLNTQNATTDQHRQELVGLQSSITKQVNSLAQLREVVDSTFTNDDDPLDLAKEISTLKRLCSHRPSTLDELVCQHDKDMDMIQQEHEEEVKALRQEKYTLQHKLQEAEIKWNHYITQQTLQIREGMEQSSSSDQLLQTLYIENQQLEQAKAAMSVTLHELKQEKQAYMKIITQLAYMSCQIPIATVNR